MFNFVDEHFNDARHTRATTNVISKVQIIQLGNYEPGTNGYSLDVCSCERLNGVTRTTPRGSFEQTES
jgi:hypothetical protein